MCSVCLLSLHGCACFVHTLTSQPYVCLVFGSTHLRNAWCSEVLFVSSFSNHTGVLVLCAPWPHDLTGATAPAHLCDDLQSPMHIACLTWTALCACSRKQDESATVIPLPSVYALHALSSLISAPIYSFCLEYLLLWRWPKMGQNSSLLRLQEAQERWRYQCMSGYNGEEKAQMQMHTLTHSVSVRLWTPPNMMCWAASACRQRRARPSSSSGAGRT